MNTRFHNVLMRSPFYSLRLFYVVRLVLSGLAMMILHYSFNSDTLLAGILNGPARHYVGIIMAVAGFVGLAGIVFKNYECNLTFAMFGTFFFGILAFDYLRHDIRNMVAIIYLVDLFANAWLFFKLRFDRHEIGI